MKLGFCLMKRARFVLKMIYLCVRIKIICKKTSSIVMKRNFSFKLCRNCAELSMSENRMYFS